jgi:diguanylate cyclase (GGDEF)-like protein
MPFALLMIDLNGFKQINDYYSHAAGDAVLITMGKRLVGSVRASDTVARLGGDEFVLLIEGIENQQDLTQIEKLLETLSSPKPLSAGVVLNVSASIGLALYPEDGTEMEDLLHTADVAMYECKSSGLMPL